MERRFSTEPLIDDDPKGILVTGWRRFAFEEFGSHIEGSSGYFLCLLGSCMVSNGGDTEITEQDVVVASEEHIFGFDIAVNEFFIVGILKCVGNLLDIRDDGCDG